MKLWLQTNVVLLIGLMDHKIIGDTEIVADVTSPGFYLVLAGLLLTKLCRRSLQPREVAHNRAGHLT